MFLFHGKTFALYSRPDMSRWIPFRILLNLEGNQITFFYYKHIRLGFRMRCCMGEWAQSTPAGATALFMQSDDMKGFGRMLLMVSGGICIAVEPPDCFKFLPTSLVFAADKLWALMVTPCWSRNSSSWEHEIRRGFLKLSFVCSSHVPRGSKASTAFP